MGRPVHFALGRAASCAGRSAGLPALGSLVRLLPPFHGETTRRHVTAPSTTPRPRPGSGDVPGSPSAAQRLAATSRSAAPVDTTGPVAPQHRPSAGSGKRSATSPSHSAHRGSDVVLDEKHRAPGSGAGASPRASTRRTLALGLVVFLTWLILGSGLRSVVAEPVSGESSSGEFADSTVTESSSPSSRQSTGVSDDGSGGTAGTRSGGIGVGHGRVADTQGLPRLLTYIASPAGGRDWQLKTAIHASMWQTGLREVEFVCEVDVRRLNRCPLTGQEGVVAEMGWGHIPRTGAGQPRRYNWCLGLRQSGIVARHQQRHRVGDVTVSCHLSGPEPERPERVRLVARMSTQSDLLFKSEDLGFSCQTRFSWNDGKGHTRMRADFTWNHQRHWSDEALKRRGPVQIVDGIVFGTPPHWSLERGVQSNYRPIAGLKTVNGSLLMTSGWTDTGSWGFVFLFACFVMLVVVVAWLVVSLCRQQFRRWRRRRYGWQQLPIVDEEQAVEETESEDKRPETPPRAVARPRITGRYLMLTVLGCVCVLPSTRAQMWGVKDSEGLLAPVYPHMMPPELAPTVQAFARVDRDGHVELVCQVDPGNLTRCPLTDAPGEVVELGWGIEPEHVTPPKALITCLGQGSDGSVLWRSETEYGDWGTIFCRMLASETRPGALETVLRLRPDAVFDRGSFHDVSKVLACQIRFVAASRGSQFRLRGDFVVGREDLRSSQKSTRPVSRIVEGMFFESPQWTLVLEPVTAGVSPREKTPSSVMAEMWNLQACLVMGLLYVGTLGLMFVWYVWNKWDEGWEPLPLEWFSRRCQCRGAQPDVVPDEGDDDDDSEIENEPAPPALPAAPVAPAPPAVPPARRRIATLRPLTLTSLLLLCLCAPLTTRAMMNPRPTSLVDPDSVNWMAGTENVGATTEDSPTCPTTDGQRQTQAKAADGDPQLPGAADQKAAAQALLRGNVPSAVMLDNECRGELGGACFLRCRFAGYGHFLDMGLMWSATGREAKEFSKLQVWRTHDCRVFRNCRRTPDQEAGQQCGFAGDCVFDLGQRSNQAARAYRCLLHRSETTLPLTRKADDHVVLGEVRTELSLVFQLALVTSHAEAIAIGCGHERATRSGVRARFVFPMMDYASGEFRWEHHSPGQDDRAVLAGAVEFNRTHSRLRAASEGQGEMLAPRDTVDGTSAGNLEFEYFAWTPGVYRGHLTVDGFRHYACTIYVTENVCRAVEEDGEGRHASHWWSPAVRASELRFVPTDSVRRAEMQAGPRVSPPARSQVNGTLRRRQRSAAPEIVVTAGPVVPPLVEQAWAAATYLHCMGAITLVVVIVTMIAIVLIFFYQYWTRNEAVLADAVRRTMGGPAASDAEALMQNQWDTSSVASRSE